VQNIPAKKSHGLYLFSLDIHKHNAEFSWKISTYKVNAFHVVLFGFFEIKIGIKLPVSHD
jgi:hypothetical protein